MTAPKVVVLDTRQFVGRARLTDCYAIVLRLTQLANGEASPGLTVQSKTMRTGAIALTALILTITVMIAPKSMPQKVAADTYGADYLVLNPEMD